MKVIVNGKELFIEESVSVTELIKTINCNINKVAIEKNGVIVPRSQHNTTNVADGDKIECVEFVGGG